MDCNACSTRLALHWMRSSCSKKTGEEKVAIILARIRFLLGRFTVDFRAPADGFQIVLDDQNILVVSSAFMVSNLQQLLQRLHLQIENGWATQWDSMLDELQMSWSSPGLPLRSIVHFAFTVERIRRKQLKPPWKRKTLEFLRLLQNGLVEFLTHVTELMVNNDHSIFSGFAVPSRATKRTSRPWVQLCIGFCRQTIVM